MPEVPAQPGEAEAFFASATFDVQGIELSPLRCFKGKLKEIGYRKETTRDNRIRLRLPFKFDNLVVCSAGSLCGKKDCVGSSVPFAWPAAEIVFNHSDGSSSIFGALALSVQALMGKGTKLKLLEGHELWIKWTAGHPLRRMSAETKEWEDYEGEAYEVMSIDGTGASGIAPTQAASVTTSALSSPTDISIVLVELADGKTQQAFNKAAFQNEKVKANTAMFSELARNPDAILLGLMQLGKLTKDEQGVWHKV